jgi:hypothetical protein
MRGANVGTSFTDCQKFFENKRKIVDVAGNACPNWQAKPDFS